MIAQKIDTAKQIFDLPVAQADPVAAFGQYLVGMRLFDALRPVGECVTPDQIQGWWAACSASAQSSMPGVR